MTSNIWSKCKYWSIIITGILLTACNSAEVDPDQKADIIFYNAYVYPVTGTPLNQGAIAVVNGKLAALGSSEEIVETWKRKETTLIDCKGKFLMPGLIEGHGHFNGLGLNLVQVNLLGTTSWSEILDSVAVRITKSQKGKWITGRGWHQEKWTEAIEPNVNGYPLHYDLTSISADHPVMLLHASGHSLFANKAAMDAAGVSNETPDPAGGMIIRDAQGNAIGVFEENAMDIIKNAYNYYQSTLTHDELKNEWMSAALAAQSHCLANGITSFHDAGEKIYEVNRYKSLAENDSLDIRLYGMIMQPYSEIRDKLDPFPIVGAGNDKYTCRTIKAYIDGALGSYGAWLLQPYLERPSFSGQNTTPLDELESLANICVQKKLQMAIHAIGDRGNREVLNIYERVLKASTGSGDHRWRIEHAQHIDPADIPRFKELNVIASMQAIHCISDAPFVEKRLGADRAREGAYVWRSLMDAGVLIANGTDAPIEKVDPFQNLYASVTRKQLSTHESFYPEQKMTREEALKAYTWNNAYAAFEENTKGSIEVGKWADLVLVSNNLMTCPEDSIVTTKVVMTVVGGEIKYKVKDF